MYISLTVFNGCRDSCFVTRQTLIYNQTSPVLCDHIKLDIFLAFQTGGCLLLSESSTERYYMYFHAAMGNHLHEKPKICLIFMVADCGFPTGNKQNGMLSYSLAGVFKCRIKKLKW